MSKFDGSKGPPNIEGMTSLKVDNLTYRTTIEDLERLFGKFGEVGDIYIPRDQETHESRGFAFVRFYEDRDAEDAMDSMDGKQIDGREIRVAMAQYGRPKNQYDPRRSGGRQFRGRGYRRGGSSYGRDRDRYRDRRRSPRRRRSHSRSHSPRRRSRSMSRSRSPQRRRTRSASRSPRYHRRSPSKSPSRSPIRSQSRVSRSPFSRSPSRSWFFHGLDDHWKYNAINWYCKK